MLSLSYQCRPPYQLQYSFIGSLSSTLKLHPFVDAILLTQSSSILFLSHDHFIIASHNNNIIVRRLFWRLWLLVRSHFTTKYACTNCAHCTHLAHTSDSVASHSNRDICLCLTNGNLDYTIDDKNYHLFNFVVGIDELLH